MYIYNAFSKNLLIFYNLTTISLLSCLNNLTPGKANTNLLIVIGTGLVHGLIMVSWSLCSFVTIPIICLFVDDGNA